MPRQWPPPCCWWAWAKARSLGGSWRRRGWSPEVGCSRRWPGGAGVEPGAKSRSSRPWRLGRQWEEGHEALGEGTVPIDAQHPLRLHRRPRLAAIDRAGDHPGRSGEDQLGTLHRAGGDPDPAMGEMREEALLAQAEADPRLHPLG